MDNTEPPQPADVCLILEGTYPYVSGGVSHWAHDLIQKQNHLTFHLVCILPPFARPKQIYTLPKNVVGLTNIYLQELPKGTGFVRREKVIDLFKNIELPLLKLQHFGRLEDFKTISDAINSFDAPLGSVVLMESEEAWNMTLRMYRATMGESSFLNFYFSWKGLMSSLFSILLAKIPPAKVYHAVSTGYAGLYLARAHLETGRPCLITEHGIYTNERRIEITLADWLYDQRTMDLSIDSTSLDRDLKDFWIDTFFGYSKLCYDACYKIITLYQGNQEYQIADGADPKKMVIIPNGVDVDKYAAIPRDHQHPPTIALIGRVVPIKDIKCYIHAASLLREKIPDLKAYIMGPTDEDKEYYQECLDLVDHLKLQNTVIFTGKVNVIDFFPKIDVVVLTSISESQPLVILEAGAAGIPCVATDSGSCPELIYGKIDENPPLGPAGAVTPLSNAGAIAENILLLLRDPHFYQACSKTIQERIRTYYNSPAVQHQYYDLYQEMIHLSNAETAVEVS
jgi:glycosyltransferase involved in cell wall biosynthesis